MQYVLVLKFNITHNYDLPEHIIKTILTECVFADICAMSNNLSMHFKGNQCIIFVVVVYVRTL